MSQSPVTSVATAPEGQAAPDRSIDGWTVRLAVTELRGGNRFYFDDEFGGEGDIVTVESQHDFFGTVEVWTVEYDFALEFQRGQMVTLAADQEA